MRNLFNKKILAFGLAAVMSMGAFAMTAPAMLPANDTVAVVEAKKAAKPCGTPKIKVKMNKKKKTVTVSWTCKNAKKYNFSYEDAGGAEGGLTNSSKKSYKIKPYGGKAQTIYISVQGINKDGVAGSWANTTYAFQP